MKRFALLLVALMALCTPVSAQTIGSSSVTSNPSAFVYPAAHGAAGSGTATTGTGTISTNQITVASAAGWLPGMGIAIHNAGTGGNTELITTVSSISGTTFTLGTTLIAGVSTQAVNHDDTAALTACIVGSALPCFAPCGTYNVTSAIPVTVAPYFLGAGTNCTFIQNRSLTTDVFFITYYDGSGATLGGIFRDFSIDQSGVATNGFAFDIAPSGGNTLSGLVIEDIFIESTYGGIKVATGLNTSWIQKIWMYGMVNAGILYSNAEPNGDIWFADIQVETSQFGIDITTGDTVSWSNIKLNVTSGTSLLFAGASSSAIGGQRFINMSIEGAGTGLAPSCGVDFGTNGANRISFVGGGVGLLTAPFCNMANVLNLELTNVTTYSNSGTGSINGRLTTPGCAGAASSCVVANLPTCSVGIEGATSFVTDQNTAASWHGAVTGSGSTKQAVVCNGSAWVQQ